MIELVSSKDNPDEPKSSVRLSSVSRYCPFCGSNTWIYANVGNADVIKGIKQVKVRCCVVCLSKGKVTTW